MKYLLSAAICFHSNTKCTTRITSGHAPSHGSEITHRTFCTYIQKRITKHFREIMRSSWRPQPATQTDFYNLAALQQSAKPAKEKSQLLPLLLILALCHGRKLHRNSPPAVQLPEHRPEMCTEYPAKLSPRPHPGISLESCRVIHVLDGALLIMELPGDAELV